MFAAIEVKTALTNQDLRDVFAVAAHLGPALVRVTLVRAVDARVT